jgi:Immunoglobulin V-set domain.
MVAFLHNILNYFNLDTKRKPPSVSVFHQITKIEKNDLVLPCVVKPSVPNQKITITWIKTSDNKPVDTGATTVWINPGPLSSNLTIKNLLTSDSGGYR